jgi:hypothetical protein
MAVVSGIIKAVEMLDKRVKGAVLQKHAIHQHHTGSIVGALPEAQSSPQLAFEQLASLDRELQAVKEKLEGKFAVVEIGNGQENSEDKVVEASCVKKA